MFKCSHGISMNRRCTLCEKEYAYEDYYSNTKTKPPAKVLLCDPSTWKVGNTLSLLSARSQLLILEE